MSYQQKMQVLNRQTDQTVTKIQKDFTRDLIENCIGLLQDLDMINNDEEAMYDEIRKAEVQTQDMVIELTFKILQPRLEFTKLEEEELREDK